jgi:hypothetical protein
MTSAGCRRCSFCRQTGNVLTLQSLRDARGAFTALDLDFPVLCCVACWFFVTLVNCFESVVYWSMSWS